MEDVGMQDEANPLGFDRPERPDLRCSEHAGTCEVVHSLHSRIVSLEGRMVMLEARLETIILLVRQ